MRNYENLHIDDESLRMMRNAVYPSTSPETVQSDRSWEIVKPNWRHDSNWVAKEYWKLKPAKWPR